MGFTFYIASNLSITSLRVVLAKVKRSGSVLNSNIICFEPSDWIILLINTQFKIHQIHQNSSNSLPLGWKLPIHNEKPVEKYIRNKAFSSYPFHQWLWNIFYFVCFMWSMIQGPNSFSFFTKVCWISWMINSVGLQLHDSEPL